MAGWIDWVEKRGKVGWMVDKEILFCQKERL